jgi:hypothetical protein
LFYEHFGIRWPISRPESALKEKLTGQTNIEPVKSGVTFEHLHRTYGEARSTLAAVERSRHFLIIALSCSESSKLLVFVQISGLARVNV